jgi:hypothetical protein
VTKASDNLFPKVIMEEVANDGSATTTPAADHRSLFLGEDGSLHLKDSAAAVTGVGGGTPDAHAASHENGGSDEIDVTGLTGAGGGGLTHSYLGYNTIGGTTEAVLARQWLAKKVTVGTAGVITSIGAYIDQVTTATTTNMGVAVFEDNAGTPRKLLASNATTVGTGQLWLEAVSGTPGDPRWMHLPLGLYVPAADYWLGVVLDGTAYNVYKDGSGADRRWQHSTAIRFSDAGLVAITTTTDRYSIRASFLSL